MRNTRRIILVLEYEGTRYHGFQFQYNAPTVQAEVEKALGKIAGSNVRVVAASRTDAGVHAKGQVVSFDTDKGILPHVWASALNYHLPHDIAVKAAYEVDRDFDVRRSAISREYRYYILNARCRSPLKSGFSYLVPVPLNVEDMGRACQSLVGEKDFIAFATCLDDTERSRTTRTIYDSQLLTGGCVVTYRVIADSFLRHQVRNTVGALLKVGMGKMTMEDFNALFQAKKPAVANHTVPAKGLFLMKVNYEKPFEDEVE